MGDTEDDSMWGCSGSSIKSSKFQEVCKVSSKFESLRSRYGREWVLFAHRFGKFGSLRSRYGREWVLFAHRFGKFWVASLQVWPRMVSNWLGFVVTY